MPVCRFITRNASDLMVLSSTVAPYATTGVANLQNPRRGRVFRFPSAGGQTIKGTGNGQGFYCSAVCLDWFNFEPAATVRCRVYPNADWTGTPSDTGTVAPYNAAALDSFTWGVDPLGTSIQDGLMGHKYWIAYFTRILGLSFQIDISDTTNSWQYNEISRLILGDYTELTYNAEFGIKFGWQEKTQQEESDGGSLLSDARIPRRAINGQFPFLNASERSSWANTLRFVGMRKPFLVGFQAGEGSSLERDFTIPQAKFAQMPDLSFSYPQGHVLPFSIVEA
jgi:hypothetical protein